MEDRRQFLKKTAMITAAGLGRVAAGVEAVTYRSGSSKAEGQVGSGDGGAPGDGSEPKDIRKLSQHFNEPDGDISPWMFVPAENIKEISTAEHPGVVTLWQAGKGKDIRGILKNPVRIEDFPLPWEFQLALVQNYWASLEGPTDPKQDNCAIGLNIALTFSDPSKWPTDRTQQPPETHSFQLFVVHLGSTGDPAPGLPQFATYGSPETLLVWGRGELDEKVNGNWNIPYVFSGDMLNAGPASPEMYFRAVMESPTRIRVGICFRAWDDFEERTIDCSKFGTITGVWEIGPIFSCDRWIPDELCKQLPVLHHLSNSPKPIAPNPISAFYVDYCVFMYDYPVAPFEHYSDDFNILGYLGQWRGFQIPFSAETWSNPGYLTITLLGAGQGVWWGPRTLNYFDLEIYDPPWEIEICFIPPEGSVPWNLFFQHKLYDKNKQFVGYWGPGVQNFPSEKRHRFVNFPYKESDYDALQAQTLTHRMDPNWTGPNWTGDVAALRAVRPVIHAEFEREVPEEILAARPLYMLYQLIDRAHVRVGFKGRREDPWYLSNAFDLSTVAKGGLGRIGESCWATVTGRFYRLPPGSPMYEKLLIDYVYYRRGLGVAAEHKT